jgi:hypothetical protein
VKTKSKTQATGKKPLAEYQVIVHETNQLTYRIPGRSAAHARKRWEEEDLHEELGDPDEDTIGTRFARVLGPDGQPIKLEKKPRRIKRWNEPRAEWAQKAVDAFELATHVDDDNAFCDLLCDLMHLADAKGVDFEHEFQRGRGHYEYERVNED